MLTSNVLARSPLLANLPPESLTHLASTLGLADRITFAGQQEAALKWAALRSAEVFALPSHTENYSVATVEALACGVPVLLSRKVNTWREIIDDGAGLAASDDEEGVKDLFRRWYELPSEVRQFMRENARQCYLRRFQLDAFVERFLETLRVALNDPGLKFPVCA